MGQSFYTCDNCGGAFGDYWDGFEMCECGKNYCCDECAAYNGFVRYDEDDEDSTPLFDEDGDEVESQCSFCRGENFTDDELLDFIYKKFSTTREEMIKLMKEMK